MSDLINQFKHDLLHTKKSLGQHFLINKHYLDKIISACNISATDNIIEIGPGCGVLTELLLKTGANITAVEIDLTLTEFLLKNLSTYTNFHIINQDVTKVDLSLIYPNEQITIVGNLPYNLSVKILEYTLHQIDRTNSIIFMFQKEVADRINAKPNSKIYSSLSVFASYYCDIKKVDDIGGGNFMPNANVTSTILKFTKRQNRELIADEEILFFEMIKLAFTQKRKTLKNNLKSINNIAEILELLQIKSDIRAEQLSLNDFIKIFKLK